MKRYSALTLLVIVFLIFSHTVCLGHPPASFEEVAQTADLIFIGTVAAQYSRLNNSGRTVFTDVVLTNFAILYASERSLQKAANQIVVTYEGGTSGQMTVSVSADSPSFTTINGLEADDLGNYNWNVPQEQAEGSYRIRVTSLSTPY